MRALRLLHWQSDPVLVDDAPMPEAGHGQVVMQVAGAGACHSDLHIMYEFPEGAVPWGPPMTLGHENTGVISELGPGVSGWRIGDRVAVHGPWGCNSCEACAEGADNYCENPFHADNSAIGGGIGLDGGVAEYMLVPDARHLVRVPDALDLVAAAPLTDAGLTPYHAVRLSLPKLTPGSHAVVVGVGGLGHMAVQLLTALSGATVIAVDSRPDALELARRCGAHHTVQAGAGNESVCAEILDLTGGRGAEAILDFVGAEDTIALGVSVGRRRGDLTVIGGAGGTFGFGLYTAPYELNCRSTMWGTRAELAEVLQLAAIGKIEPIFETYPLDEATQAYKNLRANAVVGRAVILGGAR